MLCDIRLNFSAAMGERPATAVNVSLLNRYISVEPDIILPPKRGSYARNRTRFESAGKRASRKYDRHFSMHICPRRLFLLILCFHRPRFEFSGDPKTQATSYACGFSCQVELWQFPILCKKGCDRRDRREVQRSCRGCPCLCIKGCVYHATTIHP